MHVRQHGISKRKTSKFVFKAHCTLKGVEGGLLSDYPEKFISTLEDSDCPESSPTSNAFTGFNYNKKN